MLRALFVVSIICAPLAAQEAAQPASVKPVPRKDEWWHKRHEHDPGHRWLRQFTSEAIRQMPD